MSSSDLRPLSFQRDFVPTAPGSVLVSFGNTRVICTVSVTHSVPNFLDPVTDSWLTAEYAMLPASTHNRKSRERGRADSRSIEIQRLIGRSLRHAIDLTAFSGLTLVVDCDVLQADGGTRTAAITGSWVSLYDAVLWLKRAERLFHWPLKHQVAAVSVGMVEGKPVVDLDYKLDSTAQVDMNLVADENDHFIEVQGTAEKGGLPRKDLDILLDRGIEALAVIRSTQLEAVGAKSFEDSKQELD
ncbi:MAG: ribonuclease PH [Planctomycetota bacterium]|nr:ribonuclease PH [Planctomycetota bacterium]